MELILGMAFFFVFVTMLFVAIAVFLPEWLGITGKKAKRIIAEQEDKDLTPSSTKSESSEKDSSDSAKPKS